MPPNLRPDGSWRGGAGHSSAVEAQISRMYLHDLRRPSSGNPILVFMDGRVDCHAGHRGEETPRRFDLGGRVREVLEVLDRWYGPDHRYFKVRAPDGVYILRHDEPS